MNEPLVREARCCCGALTFMAEGNPTVNVLCHCADCKRRTGSAFGWSVYFRDAQVSVAGEWAVYEPTAVVAGERCFCPRCGSTLSWRDGRVPAHIGIAAGALEPPPGPPAISNQDEDRCAWLELPSGCAPMRKQPT